MEHSLKRQRVPEISLLNVLLCLLVIFIHVSSSPVTSLQKPSIALLTVYVPWRLSAFVVQGFLFLSGLKLFLNPPIKRNYQKFYFSRLRSIVVPYLLFVLIYYLYFVKIGYFPFEFSELIRYALTGTIVSPFYFIVAVIQFYALLPLFDLMIKRIPFFVSLSASLLITLLLGQNLPKLLTYLMPGYSFAYNDRVFTTYLVYFVLGCYSGKYYENFKKLCRKGFPLILPCFLLLALCDCYFSYQSFVFYKSFPFLETLHVFYCLLAILFFFALSLLISKKRSLDGKFFTLLDKSTYPIFLLHCLVIFIVDRKLLSLGITSIKLSYLLRIVFVYGISLSLTMFYTFLKGNVIQKKTLQIKK